MKPNRRIWVPLLVCALFIPIACKKSREQTVADRAAERTAAVMPDYVGRQACIECHRDQYDLFVGSDHDMAMDTATDETVLGDFADAEFTHHGITSRFFKREGRFFVNTEGPGGKLQDYEVKYVFGIRPLQQYLMEFPGGTFQCLPLCWDTRPVDAGGQRWFHIYDQERIAPDDILFWTRVTQRWNYMCAECHSTRLRKSYDRFSEEYSTSWSEIDVSCEACHGPGSEHVRWAEAADNGQQITTSGYLGLNLRLKEDDGGTWVFRDIEKGTAERSVPRQAQTVVETCARCHARRTNIHEEYVHGRSFMDTHWPSVLEEQLYFPDGQILEEVYVYGSFLQSKMYMAGVSCRDCHEPHSGRVFAQGNALCYRCHLPEKFGVNSHHFHKDESTGALCVECHMRERTYMVVDPRRDHSMRVPRPDLADRLEIPNACILCHDHRDKSNQWAAEYTQKWYGELQDGQTHYGEVFQAGRRGYPEARDGLLRLADDPEIPPMVRATAFHLLPQYPVAQTLEALRKAVYDNDPLIRMTAVQGFEMLSTEERAPYIKHLLRDPVRVVRIRAAFLLSGAPPGVLTSQEQQWLSNAVEEYRQVQYFNADHPTAYLNLGVLATFEGDQEAAEAFYRKALEMEPLLPVTYINLADLYRTQGREADGEKILKNGIKLNSKNADLQHALGLLYVREKKIRQALSFLKRAVELAPENSRFGYVCGVALNSQGRSQEALEVLAATLERHPYDRDLLYALATMNRDLDRFEEALRYASRLAESFPDVPTFRQLEELLRQRLNLK
ncbi:MAG: tetratricopeptide repeat protein [Candidatus Aminicenantaceae bacterium]